MRPNPLEPIVINVKSLGVNLPEDYTRVFGVVSYGDTNLQANTLKAIKKSNIDELELKEGSYTENFLASFFANNPVGLIYVLETHTIPNIKQYVIGDYYIQGETAYKCLKDDVATSETDLKPVELLNGTYWQTTEEPRTYEINDLYREGYEVYECVKQDEATSLTDLIPTHLSDTTYWKSVMQEEVGKAVEVLKDFVDSGKMRVYEWACPTVFYKNADFIALVKSYAGLTSAQYFSIELPTNTDPSSDETFALYTKSKSFVPVYPSAIATESVNGAIVGVKSSSIYTLNQSNSLSLLQWKTVVGITPVEISFALNTALNENGCSWVGELNKNVVILGGLVGDGKEWNYYFALDTFIYKLLSEIATMMIQGSNNPKIALKFTQNGIDTLKQKFIAISNAMLSIGVIDEFGSDYDVINNAIMNVGEWAMIDFPTYKATQYADYKDGIYNGASCYATIGKFILQVVPNITIE